MSEKTLSFWIKSRFWFLGAIILGVGTWIFRIDGGKYDQMATSWAYDSSAPIGQRFPLGNVEPWYFFNEYNDYLTYLLAGIILIMLFLAIVRKEKFGFLLRYALFGLFALAIGPGLIVNSIFKEYWGRPRPRMTTLWPDTSNPIDHFYMVWEPAFLENPTLVGEGVSFPSGHVSIIAAYVVLFYIFMNVDYWVKKLNEKSASKIGNKRVIQSIKWFGLSFSLIAGILTGIGRIVAGAHHASDVLWAFGMVYYTVAILYYFVFKIPKSESKFLIALSK